MSQSCEPIHPTVVFYNRIFKTASSTMSSFLKRCSIVLGNIYTRGKKIHECICNLNYCTDCFDIIYKFIKANGADWFKAQETRVFRGLYGFHRNFRKNKIPPFVLNVNKSN